MLGSVRVLDLTDDRGLLCGQILGDLGADVLQIEPPGGSPARRRGAFAGDVPDPERSLTWWAYCRGKRSVALDLSSHDGRETFLRLVESAEFLIECEGPGAMERLRLGYDELSRRRPELVYVSISPFGRDGPKAGWKATDLTLLAAGGPLILSGDADRPPVRMSVPQAYHHAAAEAAVGALIAHHERVRSGRGQHVDVSVQQAVALATQSGVLAHSVGWPDLHRSAGGVKVGPLHLRFVYPAADGWVSITFLFGSAIGPFTRRLMEVIHDAGCCDAATRDKDWMRYTELLLSGEEPFDEFERLKGVVAGFTRSRTRAELLRLALEKTLLIAPVTTVDEVVESEQLAARDYWRELEHPELPAAVRIPGPFARFGSTPLSIGRHAPAVGEHTAEVLAEDTRTSARAAARPSADASGSPLPLADVKVLDLMWVLAGPAATRMLADYGATVVHVESSRRFDTARTLLPFRNASPGPENSALFHNTNAGKLMLSLNLAHPKGRDVVLDLVRWADVVTESFSPRAMRAFGFDYESLRAVKPDLIMLSSCLMGQTGPLSSFAGFGNLAAAIVGFYDICGWPDRPPAGPFGAYTDYVAPRYTAAAILAALEHRRRTGEGQYIDQSQAESALHFLAPQILDHTVNGRVARRAGNADPELAPHGVYPAAGEDRWVAIAITGDDEWRALCEAIGRPALALDPQFATAERRRARVEELDRLLADWTRSRLAEGVEAELQSRGIAASVVQNSSEAAQDPQLRHREHFLTIPHPDGGTTVIEASRFRLSRTPARRPGIAPTLGHDNQHVLEKILGYDEERMTNLVVEGVLE